MKHGFTLSCNKCGQKILIKDYDDGNKSIDEENDEITFIKYKFSDLCYEIECKQCKNIISI